ncbi:MAG TPA: PD-(D/E)XK nuclease family protein [Gammaproteobacteria bacterium]|nr:PD-(D/E)XK nuclease family protein [Gammaproteobacteria bacterium]
MVSTGVTWIPCDHDPLAHVADLALSLAGDRLPDLDHVEILLPSMHAAPRLRRLLLERASAAGHPALLGPRMGSLRDWAGRNPSSLPVVPPVRREFLMVDSLRGHRDLYGRGDPWQLAESLLELFDELTLSGARPPGSLPAFLATVGKAYGVPGERPEPLGREARLVHTLWRAWLSADEDGPLDPTVAYLHALHARCRELPGECHLILAGFDALAAAECAALGPLVRDGRAHLVLHGMPAAGRPHRPLRRLAERLQASPAPAPEPPAFEACLERVYTAGSDPDAVPLAERARAFAGAHERSPLQGRLACFLADDPEHEARAVDLQIRRWLLASGPPARIGVVTDDRRLARRLRALLERAAIGLVDSGGWALSTTRAAATLERWMQAVETGFHHEPLLDLLKSGLAVSPPEREELIETVYRLEQDIVRRENIASGLERMREQLGRRGARLPEDWAARWAPPVGRLLDRLEHAARPLADRLERACPPGELLQALRESLARLGMQDALGADAAGNELLALLERLQQALGDEPSTLHWAEFRGWLGRRFERELFRPAGTAGRVFLLNLDDTQLARFDALVIAGADRGRLPGRAAVSPFFNDAVRAELGLETAEEAVDRRLHRFRRLLAAAPRIVITHARESGGEPQLASPWVIALERFHTLAWGESLYDDTPARLLEDPRSQVRSAAADAAPPERSGLPRPALAAASMLPRRLSVSGHQRLIDCPYRFYAADVLQLKPPDEIREMLEKADYGEKVHRCLEAFHHGVDDLPGPFGRVVDASTRDAAESLLREISEAEFRRGLEDNFEHRAWLRRWLELIPAYLDWEIGEQQRWRPWLAEQRVEVALTDGIALRGRLDRIDRDGGDLTVIDYKTGSVPRSREVRDGEAVQLPSYAMLVPALAAGPCRRLVYLKMDARAVSDRPSLQDDEVEALTAAVDRRLRQALGSIAAGADLPAWGDPDTCARCEFAGVCRRQAWEQPLEDDP